MANFKVTISDPETGESRSVEIEGNRAVPLIGRKLSDVIDGTILGLQGYKLQITGGSDKDGFPIRPSVHGGVRIRTILSGGAGFNPNEKGQRRRKTVRGNTITEDIVQINTKIIEKPSKKTKEG